ncbi:PXA domain-containing protein [Aspergillus pseudocaelatus]|uniref:PXA domain-containing protein n=1 Tax=Aspergillus pseudocaelatus TaxID=1825620 RepID=A0ABQ6W4I1_9EURO|nr:PXA domain-containing protein [Aspergillus pseudocaelatus]
MDTPGDAPSQPSEPDLPDQASVAEQQAGPNNHGTNTAQSKELLEIVIGFLSTASNEVLLGVFAGLVGATYILLGRLGLLLIGVASGIVLHASWEGASTHSSGNELNCRLPKRRREIGLDIAHRLLDWPELNTTGIGSSHDNTQKLSHDVVEIDPDYTSFRPETAAALESLTDAVIRDYVNCWYESILPSERTFPLSCRRTLISFITSVSTHLSRKRAADTFLEFLTNSSSMLIVFLNELSTAFETIGPTMTPEQTIQRYLEFSPESSLASVLASQQQHKKLNLIADDILASFLDPKAYALPPLRDFLREILTGVVLESIISSLSRPEFINGWIIHLLNEGKSEIMSAIDAGVEGARTSGVTAAKGSKEVNMPLPTHVNGKKVGSETAHIDKATEEAMVEAKRLSAMIAAQDLQHQNAEQSVYHDSQTPPSSSEEDPFSQPYHGKERAEYDARTQLGFENVNAKPTQKIHEPASENAFELSPARRPSSPSSPHSASSLSLNQTSESDIHAPLTLHRAFITVDDGLDPGDEALLRSKPISNYLVQIEPASASCTGWMVFRNYTEFESLHETLATISRLNGIQKFTDDHPILPSWKGQTKQALARSLKRYLQDALQNEPLAKSERMKRFLEKGGSLGPASVGTSLKAGFSFPSQTSLENVGKGVLGVLANAPKGVSDGSKAVFGGMTGVFGAKSVKKTSSDLVSNSHNQNINTLTQPNEYPPRKSEDAGNPRRHSLEPYSGSHGTQLPSRCQRHSSPLFEVASDTTAVKGVKHCQDIPLDSPAENAEGSRQALTAETERIAGLSSLDLRHRDSLGLSLSSGRPGEEDTHTQIGERVNTASQDSSEGLGNPITQEETRIAVELIFAVINELYTLSSAWNIRRTLLNAAKSYILRPGNPNLETIRGLLQGSMIESNTSDEALSMYITKLRENVLPTEAELKSWPSAPNEAEKERLRETARKAFVQKGLPQALTSVMGAAASREALEKVFDCLQVPIIARGLVFSVLIQALRSVIF